MKNRKKSQAQKILKEKVMETELKVELQELTIVVQANDLTNKMELLNNTKRVLNQVHKGTVSPRV